MGHRLLGHRLDHVGASDEQIRAVAHHEDEVGHGRGVDRTPGAWPHDHADLRNDPRREHVALEYVGVAGEARHAFLDARPARVVQADHRRADPDRVVHDLADLLRVRLRKRAAEHREILAEHEHRTTVDGAGAGDHAVAWNALLGHAEVGAAVLDEHVDLFERAGVEQQLQTLARRQLAALVLRRDSLGPPPARAACRLASSCSRISCTGAPFAGHTAGLSIASGPAPSKRTAGHRSDRSTDHARRYPQRAGLQPMLYGRTHLS